MSYFDRIDESQNGVKGSSLSQILEDNHEEVANRRKIKEYLPLEHIFRFCKTFKKITKNLEFHLTHKTVDFRDLIYTKIGVDIIIIINCLYLYVPIFIPNLETQRKFNESIRNSFTPTFDSWTTDRKTRYWTRKST